MKPEEKAEIIIWDWLKTQSQNIIEIYFNRKNKLNWKTFKVKGLQYKPDFIIHINKGYGDKFIALEIKPCEKSIDILKGSKIMDLYFKNYIEKKTEYYIEEKKIKIDFFLIGTENSKIGYLFKQENVIDNLSEPSKKSKHYATKIEIIPRFEGSRTFEYIRFLWNEYSKIRNNYDEKVGLGILTTNLPKSSPYMMIIYYDEKKKRWSQRWWQI